MRIGKEIMQSQMAVVCLVTLLVLLKQRSCHARAMTSIWHGALAHEWLEQPYSSREWADQSYAPSPSEKASNDHLQNWLAYVKEISESDDPHEPWIDNNKFLPHRTIVVAQDGSGQFMSIQEAVDFLSSNNAERVLIHVKSGFYWEKVRICKTQQFITIEGERALDGKELLTTIAYNSTAADIGDNGLPLKTFESATFASNARNFIARNLIFKNTAPAPKPGDVGGQAVALRVSGDQSAFYGCQCFGNQDTLYDHRGRHYFQDCYVEGSIDFVFGKGRSLYKNCHLKALANDGVSGSLTAQTVSTSLEAGFSFVDCDITGNGSTFLGRAWGNDSRVIFANTFMDSVVVPEGWDKWEIPESELQKSVFYAEFNCTGPGANSTRRASWAQQLTYEQAKPFLSISYINGKKWLQNPRSIEGVASPTWAPDLGPVGYPETQPQLSYIAGGMKPEPPLVGRQAHQPFESLQHDSSRTVEFSGPVPSPYVGTFPNL